MYSRTVGGQNESAQMPWASGLRSQSRYTCASFGRFVHLTSPMFSGTAPVPSGGNDDLDGPVGMLHLVAAPVGVQPHSNLTAKRRIVAGLTRVRDDVGVEVLKVR
jgi:hypothetical protein